VPPVEPTGRPIVLRANRVTAAGLWAGAVGVVIVAAVACVALLAEGNRETPVVIGLVAVAVLVSALVAWWTCASTRAPAGCALSPGPTPW
jgi:hypothetical protein